MASPIIDVYVKLPSGKTLNFQLLSSDTVRTIYSRVAEDQSVSLEQVVIKYTGKILKKNDTLGYLGVCSETILKSEIIQVKKWNIYVKVSGGETITVRIENVSPVRYILNQLETQNNLAADSHLLKLSGRPITNLNQSVMDAGFKDETVIEIEKKKGKNVANVKSKTKTGESSESSESSADDLNAADAPKQGPDETELQVVLSSFESQGKPVEVVFSFDTTGSMYSCLQQVRSKLRKTVVRLIDQIPRIRIGIIAHGDYCDYGNYVLRQIDLTSDVDRLEDFVKTVPSTGGGDSPECYEWVLRKAQTLDWSEESAKALVVIGDCLPHPVSYTDQNINWHEELDVLKGMQVKVYGVRAQSNSDSVPFYQELSERTGGAYITFGNFSIITEMFLAVCYKEASDEQFEAYQEEMNQQAEQPSGSSEAARTADIKNMLKQIGEQDNPQDEDRPKRYIKAAWWDPDLDRGSPQYSYAAETDTWSRGRSPNHSTNTHYRAVSTEAEKKHSLYLKSRKSVTSGTSQSRFKKKSKCTVM